MLTKLGETACRMERYRCIIVSKINVTLQGHTREQLNYRKIKKKHVRIHPIWEKHTTQGYHCNWRKKNVQVDIMMVIF